MNELTLSVDSSTFGVHIKVSLFFLKEKGGENLRKTSFSLTFLPFLSALTTECQSGPPIIAAGMTIKYRQVSL